MHTFTCLALFSADTNTKEAPPTKDILQMQSKLVHRALSKDLQKYASAIPDAPAGGNPLNADAFAQHIFTEAFKNFPNAQNAEFGNFSNTQNFSFGDFSNAQSFTSGSFSTQTFEFKSVSTTQNFAFGDFANPQNFGFGNVPEAQSAPLAHGDVCDWKITECTDGIVTAIFASKKNVSNEYWAIEMEWLPPTVEYIHLRTIRIERTWKHMCLPRDLRYLHLNMCFGELDERNSPHIDFSRLPEKLEELILIRSTTGRVLCFDRMPITMRFLYIQQMDSFVRSILVNYERLPEGLQELHVTDSVDGDRLKKKVKAIGKPNGVKLQTKYDPSYPRQGSVYYERFEAKI